MKIIKHYDIIYDVYLYAEEYELKDNFIHDSELLVEKLEPSEPLGEDELKFRRPKKIFKKKRVLVTFIVILSLLVAGALTCLGFMLFKPAEVYDDSAAFYFASDLLSEVGGEFVVYDVIEFNVYNYADSLRVSKEPVDSFNIKVEADGKDITGKAEINVGETAMAPDVRCGCEVSVAVPDKYMDSVIDVTVTSEPIPKVLKGSFTLEPAWDYDVKDEKGNVCAELVIYANKDVSLELSWNSEKLIADSTDSYIRTAKNGEDKCNIQLSAGMSTTIAMFKADPSKVFTVKDKAISLKAVEYTVSEEETAETAEAPESTETEEVTA